MQAADMTSSSNDNATARLKQVDDLIYDKLLNRLNVSTNPDEIYGILKNTSQTIICDKKNKIIQHKKSKPETRFSSFGNWFMGQQTKAYTEWEDKLQELEQELKECDNEMKQKSKVIATGNADSYDMHTDGAATNRESSTFHQPSSTFTMDRDQLDRIRDNIDFTSSSAADAELQPSPPSTHRCYDSITYTKLHDKHQKNLLNIMPHQTPSTLEEVKTNVEKVLEIQYGILTETEEAIDYSYFHIPQSKLASCRTSWEKFIDRLSSAPEKTLNAGAVAREIKEQAVESIIPALKSLALPDRDFLSYLSFDLFISAMGDVLRNKILDKKNPSADQGEVRSYLNNGHSTLKQGFKQIISNVIIPTVALPTNIRSKQVRFISDSISAHVEDIFATEEEEHTFDPTDQSDRGSFVSSSNSLTSKILASKTAFFRCDDQVKPALSLAAILSRHISDSNIEQELLQANTEKCTQARRSSV